MRYKHWTNANRNQSKISLLHNVYILLTDPPPIPSPSNVTAIILNSTSLSVSWQPIVSDLVMEGHNVYFVAVKQNGSNIGPEISQTVPAIDGTQAVITDLDPSTSYRIQVSGHAKSRLSLRSTPVTVKTNAPGRFLVFLSTRTLLDIWKTSNEQYYNLCDWIKSLKTMWVQCIPIFSHVKKTSVYRVHPCLKLYN